VLCGCAGWKTNLVAPPVTPKRLERKSDAVQAFEARRDAAALEAALDRWQSGDAAGCEARLRAILQRRPDDVEARLRLGEVLAARGDLPAAERELRAVLETQPERAEARHALGLLLVAAGRVDEARPQLVRAAELEPANDIYRASLESLAARSAISAATAAPTGAAAAPAPVPTPNRAAPPRTP
jgi:Flp pilus assembly protein TadD